MPDSDIDFRRVLIILPTYDERDTLPVTWTELKSAFPNVNVLVVDDNSPDGTGAVADGLCVDDAQTFVLHREHKAGLGPAYLAGFQWACERDFDFIVQMDADGSHQPQDLRTMLAISRSTGTGLVIGSRWVSGGQVRHWSWWRRLLSVCGNVYARLMLGISVRDATAGFRVFTIDALRQIPLATVESAGYCFQVDVVRRAVQAGVSIREVPITFIERRAGHSKMSNGIVLEALWRITLWGLQRLFGRAGRDSN